MAFPNGGLITETNRQYYAGSQGFQVTTLGVDDTSFTFTFDTDLVLGSYDPSNPNYALNNFKLYFSADGLNYTEYTNPYILDNNTITLDTPIGEGEILVCQLKTLSGGSYGNRDAYGDTVEENYGSYSYIKLSDIINNFMVAYVGTGKLISDVKRTDVIFHAKRAMQEFSYDTLKSIKSQELTVPHNLSVALPQDYVNYVKISWIDAAGIKHPIYPTRLTINPTELPLQDNYGVPMQDNFDDNIDGTSITEERWKKDRGATNIVTTLGYNEGWRGYNWGYGRYYGERYGIDPQYANINGSFTINEREHKISFSSDLVDILIVLEYISDGLAYEMDTKVPKLAEEAMYAYILHAIISTRANQPEYLVNRLKLDRRAKIRNAKIRLSNIKLEEITQVLRGQSKWIKH